MSADIFLQIDDIKGESQDASHKDEIEVIAWSWGMSQSGTAHSGTGSGGGKVSVQNLSITKYFDRASPNLMKCCCSGKHFGVAKLTLRKAGDKPLEYGKIEMKDGLIASISVHGADGDERTRETLTLNFASFTCEYTPQTATGAGAGTVPMKWNIAKNAES
jgi:type VI secretion system secreted protein Hcp